MSDKDIEMEIVAAGATAPRITPADIEAVIVSEHYFTADSAERMVVAGKGAPYGLTPDQTNPPALALLTFCVLVLENGYTITGTSACASPENFRAEIGQQIARENAVNQIWPLLGYSLRSKLASA